MQQKDDFWIQLLSRKEAWASTMYPNPENNKLLLCFSSEVDRQRFLQDGHLPADTPKYVCDALISRTYFKASIGSFKDVPPRKTSKKKIDLLATLLIKAPQAPESYFVVLGKSYLHVVLEKDNYR